jgi:3-hydroxybutyryl-CoA dehydrogenase
MDEKTQKSEIVNQQSLINIAVIGSGTMGSGIAQVAATAGCIVKLFDLNQEALSKVKMLWKFLYLNWLKKKK